LYNHSFYSLEEYYEYKENTLWNWYIIVLLYMSFIIHVFCYF
jgi:hypothetical protein